jgi:thioredoxin 2
VSSPPSTEIVVCDVCGRKNRVPTAASGTPRCGNCKAPLPWIAEADDESFAAVVEESVLPVLVDLWAPWCGPCTMVSPALERLAHEYRGRLKLVKVNVDGSPRLSQRFEARSIPMMLLMRGGDVLSTQIGAAPEHAIRTWIDQHLPAPATT